MVIHFIEGYRNLTHIQIEFIRRILKECDETTSYEDFGNRLANINKDIFKQVPEIEQENIEEDLPVSSVQTVRTPQTPRMQHQPMVKKPTDSPRKENKREDRTPIRLSTKEEARRAFIYSEIFNRKY